MEQPFYVGQKVVCVNNSPMFVTKEACLLSKDKVYTVLAICKCSYCASNGGDVKVDNGKDDYWHPSRFAPITPLYADITAELAKGVQVGDEADSPIKVLN